MKCFHLYADGRVKEISWQEHQRLVNLGCQTKHRMRYRLITVTEKGMYVTYGKNSVWIPFKQLLQVLQHTGILKESVEQ
ncbi:hypothetical protein DRO41_05860 [Candidatus Bathyarchaeota archaeon]|nr:MAG: hypothetical protein DRO41_05860 [Candidatus Bathyarchaeota archaeon]